MKRRIVFSGEKGARRFRLLWSVSSFGIMMTRDKRTIDDMRREAAFQKAFESVSVEWEDAKQSGVAPDDLVKQERRDRAEAARKGEPLDEWTPRVVGGQVMRFLSQDATVMLSAKEFERLNELVEKAAPQTAPSETSDVVDLLDFMASCDKVEE